jgi:hypothetical protein
VAQPPAELPANERGLPPDQVERFDKARADLLNPRLALKEGQKDERARTMGNVEDLPKQAAEKVWRATAMLETVALAKARGEDVQTKGAVRVNSHDGLWSVFDLGKLTHAQLDDGLFYREGWESRSADMGSQLGQTTGGGAHNNDLYVFNRRMRAEALAWLAKVERAIAIRCSAEPATLQMLRRVAGDGMALSVFGKGRAFDRHLNALRRALDVAHTIKRPEAKD